MLAKEPRTTNCPVELSRDEVIALDNAIATVKNIMEHAAENNLVNFKTDYFDWRDTEISFDELDELIGYLESLRLMYVATKII